MSEAGNKLPPPLLLTTLLIALILAVADLLVVAVSVSLLIFAGLLFGVFVHGLSAWMARRTSFPYRICYAIVVALIVLLIVGGFFSIGSQAAQRANELWREIQSSSQQVEQRLNQSEWAKQLLPEASEVQESLTQSGGNLVPTMLMGLRWVGWAVTGALVIFFIGVYAAYEPNLYRTGLVKLVARDQRTRAGEVLDNLQTALGLWIIARLFSMITIGVLTSIGLWWLEVPLPITLGVLAALLTFIPNIGPLLAAVPQILLALNVGTDTAGYVVILNLALEGIESYLLTPIIQRHEVSLPPILTIAAQLIMGVLFGVIGVMMAAPVVVVVMVVVQMLYIHDQLGDPHPGRLTSDEQGRPHGNHEEGREEGP